eukprot:364905-Chlamydomonas_euryale.AAC.18
MAAPRFLRAALAGHLCLLRFIQAYPVGSAPCNAYPDLPMALHMHLHSGVSLTSSTGMQKSSPGTGTQTYRERTHEGHTC